MDDPTQHSNLLIEADKWLKIQFVNLYTGLNLYTELTGENISEGEQSSVGFVRKAIFEAQMAEIFDYKAQLHLKSNIHTFLYEHDEFVDWLRKQTHKGYFSRILDPPITSKDNGFGDYISESMTHAEKCEKAYERRLDIFIGAASDALCKFVLDRRIEDRNRDDCAFYFVLPF